MEGREAGDGCASYYNLSYSCQITTLLWFTFGDKEGPGAVHLSHGVLHQIVPARLVRRRVYPPLLPPPPVSLLTPPRIPIMWWSFPLFFFFYLSCVSCA